MLKKASELLNTSRVFGKTFFPYFAYRTLNWFMVDTLFPTYLLFCCMFKSFTPTLQKYSFRVCFLYIFSDNIALLPNCGIELCTMVSFVLRRSNFFAQALKNSAYRSPAAVASNGKDTINASITDDNLLPSPSSPFYVPVATRYMKGRRRWKFLPKLMGEDHVDPDMHARHSFEQRLRAIQQAENDESLHRVHDVGFPRVEARARRVEKAKELREARKRMKADAEMERASRLRQLEVDPVECEMEDVASGEGEDFDVAKNAARHYGVFRDLYGRHAVFSNVVHLDVSFATGVEDADGDETVAPVFYGNFVDAVHCAKVPQLEIHAGDEKYADSSWTLVMTSPDQNFAQSSVRK